VSGAEAGGERGGGRGGGRGGEDATALCHELGKKEWKARLAAAVDAAYSDHWLSNIREKLAKATHATSTGASLMPAEYVGKVVHKAAQAFGVDDDDTVYSYAEWWW
jgi:hypothetical protein